MISLHVDEKKQNVVKRKWSFNQKLLKESKRDAVLKD